MKNFTLYFILKVIAKVDFQINVLLSKVTRFDFFHSSFLQVTTLHL